MATVRWVGKAQKTAQVNTITPVAAAGATYKVTINQKDVTYTASGSPTVQEIVEGLQAALAASEEPEFQEITWSEDDTKVIATAVTAGTPFTQTSSTSGGGSLTTATVTANSSPHDAANVLNWDTGALPADGDDVYIDGTDVSLLWGLSALAGVTLASLTVGGSFTGTIGLPEINEEGASSYREYRPTYLSVGATTVSIGRTEGQGSGRIKINFGAVAFAATVGSSAPALDADLPAVILKGSNVANVLNLAGGSVGMAVFGGDTGALATLRVTSDTGASFVGGAGLTLTTLEMSGGTVTLGAGVTTVKKFGGTLTILDGNVTTLNESGGITYYLGTGTITTANIDQDGELNFHLDPRPRTVATVNFYSGSAWRDRKGTVTVTNPMRFNNCVPFSEVTLELRDHISLGLTYL